MKVHYIQGLDEFTQCSLSNHKKNLSVFHSFQVLSRFWIRQDWRFLSNAKKRKSSILKVFVYEGRIKRRVSLQFFTETGLQKELSTHSIRTVFDFNAGTSSPILFPFLFQVISVDIYSKCFCHVDLDAAVRLWFMLCGIRLMCDFMRCAYNLYASTYITPI